MIPIPEHLSLHARNIVEKNSSTNFSIECECGCKYFCLQRNVFSKTEQQAADDYKKALESQLGRLCSFEGTVDADGIAHYYKRGLFGRRKEIILPPAPLNMNTTVIRAQCTDCKKALILFDSRYHGYDAVISQNTQDEKAYHPQFERTSPNASEILIRIRNDLSYNEYCETVEREKHADYPNAFSRITIYRMGKNGRKHMAFDIETA